MNLELHIKDMVCVRCKMAVAVVFDDLNIAYKSIELGKVMLEKEISADELINVQDGLARFELYVIKDRKEILVDKIKMSITEIFRSEEFKIPPSFTAYLSRRLFYDYTHLSNIFSELEGSTIEHFYIMSRLERVKELIMNDNLSVTDISNLLGFSSVSHLCIQFKKITGKTPSEFKKAYT
jgi:AraC-like DNA-binding protein